MLKPRPAFTLIELIVALILGAIVLGIASTSLLRQQRVHLRISNLTQADRQLSAALLLVSEQLAFADRSAGDITPGQASDTALQLRAAIATSIACTSAVGSVTLLPQQAGSIALGGTASAPRPGDTLWFRTDTAWSAAEISSVQTLNATCTNPADGTGPSVRLVVTRSDTIQSGTPVRVTRQIRYAIYKSGDGTSQLGFREWNGAAGGFGTPQPTAGPLNTKAGNRQSGFRYFDESGSQLSSSSGSINVAQIARIRIAAFSLVPTYAVGQDSLRGDSADVALVHANGP